MSNKTAISHITPIGQLFSTNNKVQCFEKNVQLREIFNYFSAISADTVIINDENKTAGIITLKDLIRSLQNCENITFTAKTIMSTPVKTFSHTMSIADVLEVISQEPFDKIVVTDDCHRIIGIMDRRHLLSLCYTQLTPFIKHEYNIIHSMLGLVGDDERGLLKLATTDVLTGIGNRRLLEEIFQAHQNLGEHYDVNLFLLMFDIDNFKSINDTFGHVVGDSVLKELTELVCKSVRKSDVCIRWGGEEFVILLQYPDPISVIQIAENIRNKIDQHSFKTIVHVTCSFGLTSICSSESLNNVIERADKALYRAKADGKNTVRMELLD